LEVAGLSFRQLLVKSVVALLLGLAVSLPAAYLLLAGGEAGEGVGGGVSPVRVEPSPSPSQQSPGGSEALAALMALVAEASRAFEAAAASVVVVPLAGGGEAGFASAGAAEGLLGTNVQVEGVDEGDIADISGDGGLVAVAGGYRVLIHDIVRGGAPAAIEGPGGEAVALSFIDGRLLAVVWGGLKGAEPGLLPGYVELWIVSLEDPREPVVVERHRVSGEYVALRVDGGRILLVTDATPSGGEAPGVPWVDGVPLGDESLAALDPLPLAVIQVTLVEPGAAAESIAVAVGGDVRVVAGGGVVALAWSTPYDPARLGEGLAGVAGSLGLNVEVLSLGYADPGLQALLALASSDEWAGEKAGQRLAELLAAAVREAAGYTTTLAFIGYEGGLELRGSVRVEGALLDQFAVNPLGGGLYAVATTVMEQRVVELVYTWAEQPAETIVVSGDGVDTVTVAPVEQADPAALLYRAAYSLTLWSAPKHNAVYVVSAGGGIVGGLEGFGEGLRLRAARLVESTLYISAYTQVDPLYVVDLSDPGSPRLLAELKVPGWSEYLHYLGNGLLLGVGFTDDGKNKVTLIDVSDPASPRLVDELVVEGVRLLAAEDDYHAFTYDPETGRAFLVAASPDGRGAGVVVVKASQEGLEFEAFLEVDGALRVFAAGDRIIVAAETHVALYHRETLEPLVRALTTPEG